MIGRTSGVPLARLLGVRHLSPLAALHLDRLFDELKPTAVLIEGPADALERMKRLIHPRTRPPVTLLAYTKQRPVRSILYPLAAYSPEWAALSWAVKHETLVQFIDLPAEVTLAMMEAPATDEASRGRQPPDSPTNRKNPGADAPGSPVAEPFNAWKEIPRLTGDPDYETWWERHFEHTREPAAYFESIQELGRGLRDLTPPAQTGRDPLREAHMRRCIRDVLKQGHDPEKVVVVCGAMHVPALTDADPPLSDEELAALPRIDTLLTLMPYSYPRLSSLSGYGAGNHAPLYFQRLYERHKANEPERLPEHFLSELAQAMRQSGQVRSSADVIEAVRLANALAAINQGVAPTLRDLRDAAMTCLGQGEFERIRPHLAKMEVGDEVGRLPPDVGQTALQEDFEYQLDRLKLAEFKRDSARTMHLDLREKPASSADEALLDRNRSAFLHRLVLFEVPFPEPTQEEEAGGPATPVPWQTESEADALRLRGETAGTFRERWKLRWTPECDIRLAESSMIGDTVEAVAAQHLHDAVAECQKVGATADIVRQAVLCQLTDALVLARERLQALAVEDSNLPDLARAVQCLGDVIRYGGVRKVDPEPFKPLLFQLFLRATLQLSHDCHCQADAAPALRDSIVTLDQIAGEHPLHVDGDRWKRELDLVARSDSVQSYLAGFVTTLLLSQGRFKEDELATEVHRRLSPATDLPASVAWLEGLLAGNRQALFAHLVLWRQLDLFLTALDDEEFHHALVPLRRTFGALNGAEVRRVIDNLAEIDLGLARQLAAVADVPLAEEELKIWENRLEGLEFPL